VILSGESRLKSRRKGKVIQKEEEKVKQISKAANQNKTSSGPVHSQVSEKIVFRTFKDWLRSLTPDTIPRDKKGSALLPKDSSGFKIIG